MILHRWFTGSAALLLTWIVSQTAAQEALPAVKPVVDEQAIPLPQRVDQNGDPLPVGVLARLGTVRLRHGGRVLAVTYAPDGKSLVSASQDQTVRRWDAATGKELQRLSAPGFLTLSPDGTLFARAEVDNPQSKKNRKIRLVNTVTGKEIGRLEWQGQYGETGNANHIIAAFSPDCHTLAVGSYVADVILLWDVVRGKEIRTIEYVGLADLAFSPDGKALATAPDDVLWDIASGKPIRSFKAKYRFGHTDVLAFTPDGKTFATGGHDGTVLLFDMATGQQTHKLQGQGKYLGGAGRRINSLAFTPDGKTLAVGSDDWTVRLWDVQAGKQLHQLIGPTFGNSGDHGCVRRVAFSPDGQTLAVASNVPLLRRWDTASGKEILPPASGHRDQITTIAVSPNGKTIASASIDLTVRLWDAGSGKEIRQFQGHEGSINGIAFSPDGRRLVSAGGYNDETLRVWDTETGRQLLQLKSGYAFGVAFSPDGKTIATAGSAGVRLWDAQSGAALRQFAGNTYSAFFSPDGRRLSDGLRFWELASGRLIADWKDRRGVAFSPDWKLLASAGDVSYGSGVYAVRLVEVITGKEIYKFTQDKGWVSSAVFSPDGQTLATAESTGIRLWDTTTGKEIRRLTGEKQSWYYALAFAPDGRTLVSANSDTTVLVWNVPAAAVQRPPARLPPQDLPQLWEQLASDDAASAFQALGSLQNSPQPSVPYLRDRVKPVAAPGTERLKQLIADLDSDRFAVRQKASEELQQLGELAEPTLHGVLDSKPSLEVRERVEALLARRQVWSGERLRQWRAIQVLEGACTAEAQAVLKTLAMGALASRLTQEAQASLDRLAQRARHDR